MGHAPQDQTVCRRLQLADAFTEQVVNRAEILAALDRSAGLDGGIELAADRTLHPEVVVAQNPGSLETRRALDHAEPMRDVEHALHMEGDRCFVTDAVRAGLGCDGDATLPGESRR